MKVCTAVQEGCGYKDTLRASLLCSVGKIFHCVDYLPAAPRIIKVRVILWYAHDMLVAEPKLLTIEE